MNTATTSELCFDLDPSLSRAVALEAAGRCGVPFEALNEVRAMPAVDMAATDWLQLAIDAGRRFKEAA